MPGECEAQYTISPSEDSTIAVEICKTGLMRKRKHLLFFQNFSGELSYSSEQAEVSRLDVTVDAKSIVCRDQWLKARKQRRITEYARSRALAVDRHPEIRFSSNRIAPKPLRGFIVEGVLNVCGTTRVVKVNLVLSVRTDGRLQLDADSSIRLTDFGISPPSSYFGLAGTKDEAVIHLLLWARAVERIA
ncbi:MAG TPA: YceI family protein [Bryobacteraceae bacterium]|jgi:polyisoprenoid-binding protein YceI